MALGIIVRRLGGPTNNYYDGIGPWPAALVFSSVRRRGLLDAWKKVHENGIAQAQRELKGVPSCLFRQFRKGNIRKEFTTLKQSSSCSIYIFSCLSVLVFNPELHLKFTIVYCFGVHNNGTRLLI